MGNERKVILDMDGTLYAFDKKEGNNFAASRFARDIEQNILIFLGNRFNISEDEARSMHREISHRHKGEVSLGLEKEFGINRYEYFAQTWDLLPGDYIDNNPELPSYLSYLKGNMALLTLAPNIWAVRVLSHLHVLSLFDGKLFCGEPDLRKPNPLVFQQIADDFGVPASSVISVGDQEQTDIIPPKK